VLLDDDAMSVKYEEMAPSTCDRLHYHDTTRQFFYCILGKLTVMAAGERFEVNEQQGFLVRAGVQHQVINASEELVSFLVTSIPPVSDVDDRTELARGG